MLVGLVVTKQQLELSVDSRTDQSNSEQLSILHQAMMTDVVTYLGGLPGELPFFLFFYRSLIPFSLTRVGQNLQLYKKLFPQMLLVSSSLCSFWVSQLFNRNIIRPIKRHESLWTGLDLQYILLYWAGDKWPLCFLKCHQLAQFRNSIRYVRKLTFMSKLSVRTGEGKVQNTVLTITLWAIDDWQSSWDRKYVKIANNILFKTSCKQIPNLKASTNRNFIEEVYTCLLVK